ncbi:MAG TPA: hypothetical protein PK821_00380 [Victivallales bacterium]|mgnify:CR=1 FL=1|nr:hypothetical protein [Victivallales bacterium]
MKKFFAILLILTPIAAFCQIAVGISVNQESYLLYENIMAKIEVRNLSGKALIFGEMDNSQSTVGEIEFIIEGPGGIRVEGKRTDYNPMSGFVMAPGASQTVMVPVNRLYIIDKPGTYSMRALVGHSLVNGKFETPSVSFTIFNGLTVWEKQLGVPKLYYKEGEAEPLQRTVKLLSFYDKSNKYFAIMVEDKQKVYTVRRLGYDIGGAKPKVENDMLSRTHVMTQISPIVYVYYVFDINGELSEKEVYSKTDSSPIFVLDPDDGSIMVVGGKKAVKDVDYIEEDGIPIMKSEK